MSNISQFFKGDTRKKNRKIFVGPSSNVTWTAPPSTTEVDVHVWGGGGDGHTSSAAKNAGGGGGYVGNTFAVIGGTTVVISCGAHWGNIHCSSYESKWCFYINFPLVDIQVTLLHQHLIMVRVDLVVILYTQQNQLRMYLLQMVEIRVTSLKSTPQCVNGAGGVVLDSYMVLVEIVDQIHLTFQITAPHPTAPANQGQGGGGFEVTVDGGFRGPTSFQYKECWWCWWWFYASRWQR